MAKDSRRLVIDASVARAAGKAKATSLTSVHCHDFLEAVLNICYTLVMTPEIKEEWNKHQSNFARTWRRTMVAKRKFEFLDIPVNKELWNQIDQMPSTDRQCAEMFKDLRLIEAALETDKIIVSLDDKTARKFFSQAAFKVDELKDIVWVNPDKVEEEKPIDWQKKGAPPESDRLLGSWCEQ